ncbi:GMC family oxidoreductase [Clostridium sp. YIM B02505]|uniref:GMC family oxidoreductase n=1 Tax=Clostridium yunnanense TaxID=2800325 RepID=A0ABS1ER77_9CLOT|nr:GMC family oxidoreductase [Clostridium yunnanense]MBK1811905.1 GMC family oxidoreductase [Clostridium yunnanense]
MPFDADVIIIGAGGGGAVVAKELGSKGIKVLLLEAGPWYGNKKWPNPNTDAGGESSSNYNDLSKEIYDKCFTDLENDMNDSITGKLRWGPADRSKTPWARSIPQRGYAWQNSGVGGTTVHYFANSPRAYPASIDDIWPISYKEMLPYYEKVEATLPVLPAPVTPKEELFYYGAQKAGWQLLKSNNITSPGYRPQPLSILHPDPNINDPNFDFDKSHLGCTLKCHCANGCNTGPTVDKIAKRSTLVSYIPLALKTGNVEIRPNTFVTKILTERDKKQELRAVGVLFRDTWTGEIGELRAKVVVMSAGAIETPRLWMNSELPYNPWVGRGLSNHWFDCVSGIFDEKTLMNILGTPGSLPFVGQTSGARFDYPGLGILITFGLTPGLHGSLVYGTSEDGYSFLNNNLSKSPQYTHGNVVGPELKELMSEYSRTLSMLVIIDDDCHQRNGVTLDPVLKDEHGFIPVIRYEPSKKDAEKREKLTAIGIDILRKAGAKKVIRNNMPPGIFIHLECTMRMGYVTDTNCETHQVKRLYIADNSVLYNGIGGPNPTLTTQALATRTADKLAKKYFD